MSTIPSPRILATVLAVVAAAVFASSGASAQTPVNHCGQTLEQPGVYTLIDDLDCSGTFANGINVAASDVTLHLANHTLSSTDCDSTKAIYGVFAPGNVSNIKIDGGTVRGFGDAIVLSSSKSRITAMTVTGACQFGIALESTGNTVTTSRINHNAVDGIGLQVATDTHIVANDISDNRGNGVGLSQNSNKNIIAFNFFSHNGDGRSGILISSGVNNIVANNALDSNFDGIVLEDQNNVVRENTISGSLDAGIYLAGSASPSVVKHNIALGSAVSDMSDASIECGLNTWKGDFFGTDSVAAAHNNIPGGDCIH